MTTIERPLPDVHHTELPYVHVNALIGYRAALTAQINQHAEDAAMWIAPESTGWGPLTLAQRAQLTRQHLDHLDRLGALRDQVDHILAEARRADPPRRTT